MVIFSCNLYPFFFFDTAWLFNNILSAMDPSSCVIQMFGLLFSTPQVLDKYHPPDHFLPESYTCFFLLKMPRYSCKLVLQEKLKYAIHFCKSIDTDDYARVALTGEVEETPEASDDSDDIQSLESDGEILDSDNSF